MYFSKSISESDLYTLSNRTITNDTRIKKPCNRQYACSIIDKWTKISFDMRQENCYFKIENANKIFFKYQYLSNTLSLDFNGNYFRKIKLIRIREYFD